MAQAAVSVHGAVGTGSRREESRLPLHDACLPVWQEPQPAHDRSPRVVERAEGRPRLELAASDHFTFRRLGDDEARRVQTCARYIRDDAGMLRIFVFLPRQVHFSGEQSPRSRRPSTLDFLLQQAMNQLKTLAIAPQIIQNEGQQAASTRNAPSGFSFSLKTSEDMAEASEGFAGRKTGTAFCFAAAARNARAERRTLRRGKRHGCRLRVLFSEHHEFCRVSDAVAICVR